MKLLFLACLSPKTGNCTTAERIRAHVESAGHTCVLRDASEFKSSAEVAKLVTQKPPFDGALAIHLYKAGRLLLDVPVPFGVVFGGTDINEDVKVEHKLVVMKQVLLKARFAVAFTAKMKQMAYVVLRSPSSKIYVQPQGIRTEATEKFSWGEFLKSSGLSGARAEQHRVFLLVCGLRRVKDPLYLAEVFTEWHREDPLNVLVIIGPERRWRPLLKGGPGSSWPRGGASGNCMRWCGGASPWSTAPSRRACRRPSWRPCIWRCLWWPGTSRATLRSSSTRSPACCTPARRSLFANRRGFCRTGS
ncbi:glycosyltransferase 1 domain-containing protein 1 isoform X4 [Gadus morhua]|uniref:glycosyltransferase 1 domain-containing protein 1 isoform X4 n=1 Tax=Gadus morhua TaxID=8049 RepID=UPI0011B7EC9E|nr:glycosyltransferase 1 domain-containing protein 1 isoform X4 [Gadus morhua]XP_056448475.1 glycosyltransferase 1 domain-containing protein 1-like isoform X4 [Gadus chalcogrammus]